MQNEQAREFLQVHHRAVREIANQAYSQDIIKAWAPLPITRKTLTRFLQNPDKELRLVAELGDKVVGIGALVPAQNELRACYVSPDFERRGVGTALMAELEAKAKQLGLEELKLNSSINAELFYQSVGYTAKERAFHMLNSGQKMECIRMYKRF